MSTPAERYAAARQRGERTRQMGPLASELEIFTGRLDFTLDEFQRLSCEHLASGRDVLVAAPTGAGKTVVGEFAVHLGLAQGRKTFYTTPIKALSNQKYTELAAVHGSDRVGLLTGDVSINSDADVVVMTTEVLRNMIYASSSSLDDLGYVVMDEVHYLADAFRGPVWEEVILLLSHQVRLVSLSATVSNAEEFGAWLSEVRGETSVVVSEIRPVPLWQHMMVRHEILDLYTSRVDPTNPGPNPPVNPDLLEAVRRAERTTDSGGGRPARGRNGRERARGHQSGGARGGIRPPRRDVVVERLDSAGLLPAIIFIFSRAGCEAAVDQVLAAGTRLTTEAERREIAAILEPFSQRIPAEDLHAVNYSAFASAAMRGVASHHAGMLPVFKEAVEALFVRGLIKVVFATETLALGINMPARSVVIERLVKWDGREHAAVTPGQYTQLTGRAGRRGIDVEGHAVVLYGSGVDPLAVAGLASRRTYPLRSSFRPTYNMAVNLLARRPRAQVRDVLEQSFAQFQADRSVVHLARQVRKHEEALAGYTEAMFCDRGDIAGYLQLRRDQSEAENQDHRMRAGARKQEIADSLTSVRRGDVIEIPRGRRSGWAVVLDAGSPSIDGPRLSVLTDERQVTALTRADAPQGVRVAGSVKIPPNFNPRDAKSRRDLASSLRNALAAGADRPVRQGVAVPKASDQEKTITRIRTALRTHPCHECPDREDHLRWARRAEGVESELAKLNERVAARTTSIARDFDRVCEVLTALGYLEEDGESVTSAGKWLRRLYSERDLVLAESLRQGAWTSLGAAELAAAVTTIVYASRGGDEGETRAGIPQGVPSGLREALVATSRIALSVESLEMDFSLTPSPAIDTGLVRTVLDWAQGAPLVDVLSRADLAAGDLVRWCKQVIDVLDQLREAAPDPATRKRANEAIALVRRGIVAQEIA